MVQQPIDSRVSNAGILATPRRGSCDKCKPEQMTSDHNPCLKLSDAFLQPLEQNSNLGLQLSGSHHTILITNHTSLPLAHSSPAIWELFPQMAKQVLNSVPLHQCLENSPLDLHTGLYAFRTQLTCHLIKTLLQSKVVSYFLSHQHQFFF